jgi:GTP-binding protein
MAIPKVAIIGRPNVGKSSLFNALAGKMISIVEPTAGVTRDRISTTIESDGKYFELIDTGGIGIVDKDHLGSFIEKQIAVAIETADLILFLVDIRAGILPLDEKIARLLRKKNSKVIGVATKADAVSLFPAAAGFERLGFGEFLCVSAANNINKRVLFEKIAERIGSIPSERPSQPVMKIAIVGKRNAGKSTFVNAIVGEERVIVSEVPGTTRDSVDVRFEKDGRTYILIDTAGVRRKSAYDGTESIDFYSFVRAKAAVRRADCLLFLIDASMPVSDPDKKLSALIAEEYKPCVIVLNKWDLAEKSAAEGAADESQDAGVSGEDYQDYITKMLPALKDAPIAFTIATEAKNVDNVLNLAFELFAQANTWIPTPKLNAAFEKIKAERQAASKRGAPKIYYATQVAVNPVSILMFVNKPELFDNNYRRFISNRLHDLLPVPEVPIKLLARSHREEETDDERQKPNNRRQKTSGSPRANLRHKGTKGKNKKR